MTKQREKLIELICKAKNEYYSGMTNAMLSNFIADYLIANGVVVPVWCMECTHGEDDGTGIQCHKHNNQFGDYDFCSCGERRSNNK